MVVRYVVVFVCIGALALIGPASRPAEKGGVTDTARACETQTGFHRRAAENAEGAGGERKGPAGTRLRESCGGSPPCTYIVVDGLPRMLYVTPQVRGFHPYPECEIVGMPFAGVKMCR
jgi:hypothetical protein